MKIDFEQIEKETGITTTTEGTHETKTRLIFDYMLEVLEWLTTHNKNYTKQQEQKIDDVYSIIKNIIIEE